MGQNALLQACIGVIESLNPKTYTLRREVSIARETGELHVLYYRDSQEE